MKLSQVGPLDRSQSGGHDGEPPSPRAETPGLPSRWKVLILASIVALIVIATGLGYRFGGFGAGPMAAAAAVPAAFVGSEACASCHEGEATLWQTSQHRHA